MTITNSITVKLMLIVTLLSIPEHVLGKVDPQWLKSWNLAVDMRPANVSDSSVLVSPNEPGIPLMVHGQIFKPDGVAVAKNVLVHMYHRDHQGYDFGAKDKELATWRLQAWAKTNDEGKFEFRTIRPAPDHLGREGGHFHFTVVSSEFGKQWLQKIHFLDEHKISNQNKQGSAAQGKFSWLKEVKTHAGIQHIDVAFKLKPHADFY